MQRAPAKRRCSSHWQGPVSQLGVLVFPALFAQVGGMKEKKKKAILLPEFRVYLHVLYNTI